MNNLESISMINRESSWPRGGASHAPSTSNGRCTVLGLAAALLLGGCSRSTNGDAAGMPKPSSQTPEAVAAVVDMPLGISLPGNGSIADVAARVTPSVVSIQAERVIETPRLDTQDPFFNDPFFRHYFDRPGRQPRSDRREGLGSGVIVSADGLVVTNHHLIEKAENIKVFVADGQNVPATVVGTDPKSDLAVLRVEGGKNLVPLSWGDSSKLRMGDLVLAIGNPYGVGQTVTMGIVSATGRGNVGIVDYEDFIQTDAAINPGNSGGALVNMRGELIGINTAILSRSGGNQGVGFAIPANLAKPVIDSLIKSGKFVRGWLGVTIQNLNSELAEGLGIDARRGALVSDVAKDTPAAKAGLRRGDVVTKVNGKDITSTAELRNLIAQAGPGAKVRLEVLRGKATVELEAVLEELPTELVGEAKVSTDEGALAGATFGDITADTRRRFDIPESVTQGVVITGIEPGSRAERTGLQPGDIILELNRKTVKSAADFLALHTRAKEGAVLLLIKRGSSTIFLAVPN